MIGANGQPTRRLVLVGAALLVGACEQRAHRQPAVTSVAPTLPVLYGDSVGLQPLWLTAGAPVRAQLGRGVAPLAARVAPIVAPVTITTPLLLPTVWQLPSARPLAAIAGLDGGLPQVELLDIDAGEVLWRDRTTCTAPIVAVTSRLVICGDGHGLRALDLTGSLQWSHPGQWVATTGGYLVVSNAERTELINVESGALVRELKLPTGVAATALRGVCRHANGLDLVVVEGAAVARFTASADPASPLTASWTTAIAALAVEITDAAGGCRDEWLVQVAAEQGIALISLSRVSGAAIARMADVVGLVRRRDDSLLVSTPRNVMHLNRRLVPLATDAATTRRLSDLPPFGRTLATFGDAALVHTSAHTAMLLDPTLHAVWFELSGQSAALGAQYIVAGNRMGSVGESLHRYVLPVPARDSGSPPTPTRRAVPGYVAAELRDLPAAVPLALDHAITAVGEAAHWVGAALLDPAHHEQLFVVTLAQAPSDRSHAGISLLDLRSKQWRWHAHDACGVGSPIAIAKSESSIICASQGNGPNGAAVTASNVMGQRRWQWHGATIDAITAQGSAVMLHHGASVTILDDTTGALRGEITLLPSTPARAALIASTSRDPWLVVADANRVIVYSTAVGLLPLWAIEVQGEVETLQALGASVVVSLVDGDSYVVDLATAKVRAVPTMHDRVMVLGDLLSSERLVNNDAWQQALLRPDASLVTRNEYAMVVTVPRPTVGAAVRGGRRGQRGPAPAQLPPRIFHYPASASYVRSGGSSEILLTFSTTHVAAVAAPTGTPRTLVTLPPDATGVGFATEVDGQPRTGVLLYNPLRAVLF